MSARQLFYNQLIIFSILCSSIFIGYNSTAATKVKNNKFYDATAGYPQLWESVEDRIIKQCSKAQNLALSENGVKVQASVEERKSGQGNIEYIIDGKDSTYWMGSYMKEVPKRAKITIIFPVATTFNCVHWWYQKEGEADINRKPKDYDLKISDDGKEWKTILKVRGNRLGNRYESFAPVHAKYLMMEIIKCERLNKGRPKIYAVEVYNLDSKNSKSDWSCENKDYRIKLPIGRGRKKGWFINFNALLNNRSEKFKSNSLKVVQADTDGKFIPAKYTFTTEEPQGEGILKIYGVNDDREIYAYFNISSPGDEVKPEFEFKTDMKRRNYIWNEDAAFKFKIKNNTKRTYTANISYSLCENGRVFKSAGSSVKLVPEKEDKVTFKLKIPVLTPGNYELNCTVKIPGQKIYKLNRMIGIWQPIKIAFPLGIYTMPNMSYKAAAKHLKILADNNISCIPGYRSGNHLAWRYIMDEGIKYKMGTIAYASIYSTGSKYSKLTSADGRIFKGIYDKAYEPPGACFGDTALRKKGAEKMQKALNDCLPYPSFLKKIVTNDDVHFNRCRAAVKKNGHSYPNFACYCENCRKRFEKLTANSKLPKPWEVNVSPRILPDNDIWLEFMRFRDGDVYNGFNKAVVDNKNKVNPNVKIGGVTGSTFAIFEPLLGHYPPLDKLDVVSSYYYPQWGNRTCDYIILGEYSLMGNRNKKSWMLGGELSGWKTSDAEITNIVDHKNKQSSIFPKKWKVFGKFKRNMPVPREITAQGFPETLTMGEKTFKPKTISATSSRINFGKIFNGHSEGWTAYAVTEVNLLKGRYVTIGFGADWWAQWWIDGKPVYDTMEKGNRDFPLTVTNHMFKVHLTKGKHVIALKVVSGRASWAAVFGNETEIERQKKQDANKRKTYLAPEGYVRSSAWMMLAAGNKLIWFFTYGKGLPPESHCMQELKRMGYFFRKYGDLLAEMRSPRKPVAVLASFTQTVYESININEISEYLLYQRRLGRSLLEKNIPFEFVSEEEIKNGYLKNGTDVLVISRQSWLPESAYNKIKKFVKNGGKLVITRDVELSFPGAIRTTVDKLPAVLMELTKKYPRFSGKGLIVREMIAGNSKLLIASAKTYRTSIDCYLRVDNISGYAYNIIKHKYLGKTPNLFPVKLKRGDGTVIAILPDKIMGIKITGPDSLITGDKVKLKCEILDSDNKCIKADIPLWIDVINPQGKSVFRSFSALAKNGSCQVEMPVCINDPEGKWKLRVSELFSGKRKTKSISVMNK